MSFSKAGLVMFTKEQWGLYLWIICALALYAAISLYLRNMAQPSVWIDLSLGCSWLAIIALGELLLRRRS
jgi:hypothetical protein